MGWEIRTHDCGEILASNDTNELEDIFTLEIHHGGKIANDKEKEYVGGNVSFVDNCDPDTMSMHEVRHMLAEIGSTGEVEVYFLQPECTLDTGLHVVKTDLDVLAMCAWAKNCKGRVMPLLYCHVVDNEEDELPKWLDDGICAYADTVADGIDEGATEGLTYAIFEEVGIIQGEYVESGDFGMNEHMDTDFEATGNAHIESDTCAIVEEDRDADRVENVKKTAYVKRKNVKKVNKRKPFSQHGDWGEAPRRHIENIGSMPRARTENVNTEVAVELDVCDIMENMDDDELRSICDSSDEEEVRSAQEEAKKEDSTSKEEESGAIKPTYFIATCVRAWDQLASNRSIQQSKAAICFNCTKSVFC